MRRSQNPLSRALVTALLTMRYSKSGGLSGVQRGLGVAVLREGSKCSIRIGLYEPIFSSLEALALPGARVIAAVCTGATSAVVFSPLDLLKSRVFASGSHGTPSHHAAAESGAMAAAREALASSSGLFSGVGFNVFRSVCWATVQLPIFFTLEPLLSSFFRRESYAGTLLAASISACSASIFIQPADVLRTRAYNASDEVVRSYLARAGHRGRGNPGGGLTFHIRFATGLVAAEGVSALWKGVFGSLSRTLPHTVLTFIFIRVLRERWRAAAGIDDSTDSCSNSGDSCVGGEETKEAVRKVRACSPVSKATASPLSTYNTFLAGSFAGAVKVALLQPLDTLKVLLQIKLQSDINSTKSGAHQLKAKAKGKPSALSVASSVIRERGIVGFYAGKSRAKRELTLLRQQNATLTEPSLSRPRHWQAFRQRPCSNS